MPILKPFIEKLADQNDLTREEAASAVEAIISDEVSGTEIGALLIALRMKGESIEEIAGFVDTMEKHMVKVNLQDDDAIDVCGTGGDGKNSFNVSTTVALVVAGAGVTVAKHGNRSVSSKCGSADVLDSLGVKIDLGPEQNKKCIDEIGIGFFFAPLYHPALKTVIQHRKNLGMRTIFNMLGPLLNPAGVKRQLIGVFDVATSAKLAGVVKTRNYKKACTIHSSDGYDELSPFAENQIFEFTENRNDVAEYTYSYPSFNQYPELLDGADSDSNARVIQSVLNGKKNANREMTILNAGFALHVADKVQSVDEGFRVAEETIDSGLAKKKLEDFVEMSNSF